MSSWTEINIKLDNYVSFASELIDGIFTNLTDKDANHWLEFICKVSQFNLSELKESLSQINGSWIEREFRICELLKLPPSVRLEYYGKEIVKQLQPYADKKIHRTTPFHDWEFRWLYTSQDEAGSWEHHETSQGFYISTIKGKIKNGVFKGNRIFRHAVYIGPENMKSRIPSIVADNWIEFDQDFFF
jgi:hypothetical protein